MTEAEAFDHLAAALPPDASVHVARTRWVHNVDTDGPGPCVRGETWSVAIRQELTGCIDGRASTGADLRGVVARAMSRWRRRAERAERLGVPRRILLDSGDVLRVRVLSGRLFVRSGGGTWEASYLPDPARRVVTLAGIVPRERRQALLEHAVRQLATELGRRKAAA